MDKDSSGRLRVKTSDFSSDYRGSTPRLSQLFHDFEINQCDVKFDFEETLEGN